MQSARLSVPRALLTPVGCILAAAVTACASSLNLSQNYTAPGWYLEKPRPLLPEETRYIAGPFSYDDCEAERLKTRMPELYLCNREIVRPSEVYNQWKAFRPVSDPSTPPSPKPPQPSQQPSG